MRRIIQGKFFQKLLISFTALIVIGVLGVSLALYLGVGGTVQRMQYENTQKLFEQTAYTFGLINENVSNISIYLYYANEDVRTLMFDPDVEVEIANGITAMNRVRRTLFSVSPGIHSIYVFNAHTERFYSSYRSFLHEDEGLLELLESLEGNFRRLVPLYRYIGDTTPVFTYLMYGRMRGGQMNGGIALNVDARVFLDALWPDSAIYTGEAVFLITEDGQVIDAGGPHGAIAAAVLAEAPDLFSYGQDASEGFLSMNLLGQRYLISYSHLESFGMLLVSAQPYAAIEGQISALRNTILIITLVFLALMFVAALMVSRMLYNPVKTLVSHTDAGGKGPVDEISYLNELYSRNKEMLTRYETELESYERVKSDTWFKTLITGDIQESEADMLIQMEDYGFIRPGGFYVCVLRLSKFAELEKSAIQRDLILLRFAILNVASEIFSQEFECYGVDFKDDHVVVVLSVTKNVDIMESIVGLSQKAMAFIAEHFMVTVTVSVSSLAESPEHIATAYTDAVVNSDYRFVLGADAVITPKIVAANLTNDDIDFTFENERVISEAIKQGERERVIEAVDAALGSMVGLKYHNIVISIIHLTHTVIETVSDTRKTAKRVEAEQNLGELLRGISSIETAAEYKERLMQSLEPLLAESRKENTKYTALTQQIKEYVEDNLEDPNLCLTQIADMTRMSSKHINHIFKSCTGISIPEHITNLRMKKAVSMLETTSMSIKEIAMAVGMENQTYFYSKFKKHFGMSPKTYQLDFLMKQNKTGYTVT